MLKHYIKITYKVVLLLLVSFHTIQTAFYHFYTFNIICLHCNYAHKLNQPEWLKHLTILLN